VILNLLRIFAQVITADQDRANGRILREQMVPQGEPVHGFHDHVRNQQVHSTQFGGHGQRFVSGPGRA
jgi:hypothetical protein